MKNQLGYQVVEDNGGGLHLAVFDGPALVYYSYGFEHDPQSLRDCLTALEQGDGVQGWELPDLGSMTMQEHWDQLTSYPSGWQVIAEDPRVTYPDRMGSAGLSVFRPDDCQ